MAMLFESDMKPGNYYYMAMFILTILILLFQILPMLFQMYKAKSGFASDPIGGLSSGADLRFAGATDTGTPGGVVAYQSFVNPEPPVFYNIGDVEATRAHEVAAAYQTETNEGYAPSAGLRRGFAPALGGGKKGFSMPMDHRRWQKGAFTDQDLLRQSQHS